MGTAKKISERARELAAEQQSELLGALVGDAAVPRGFRKDRVLIFRKGLRRKRLLAVAAVWDSLARSLGDKCEEYFLGYCARSPFATDPLADGRQFARFVASKTKLADVARIQVLGFDLRYRLRRGRAISRRGFMLRCTRLRKPPHIVVGVRAPFVGVRVLLVPVGGKRLSRSATVVQT